MRVDFCLTFAFITGTTSFSRSNANSDDEKIQYSNNVESWRFVTVKTVIDIPVTKNGTN